MNKTQGFIQIPLLVLIFLGTLVVSGGGYYVAKRAQPPAPYVAEPAALIEKDKQATTSAPIKEVIHGKAPLFRIINPVPQKTAVVETPEEVGVDFNKLIASTEEQIILLEQDKQTFLFLRKTIDEHQQKAIKHATEMMGAWINFADTSITSVPSEYQRTISLTRESMVSDREYLVQMIRSHYLLLDSYFIDPLRKEKMIDAITVSQANFSDCIKTWGDGRESFGCQLSYDLLPSRRKDYADSFKKITEKLVEYDDYILEAIGTHARGAEKDIADDLERISRMAGTLNSVQSSLNAISQQLQQSQTSYQVGAPIKCFTTTNDPILAPSRTYTTTCEPDTRTAKEICDAQIASWLGGGAITPKPSCE
jgi:hypothetical protein